MTIKTRTHKEKRFSGLCLLKHEKLITGATRVNVQCAGYTTRIEHTHTHTDTLVRAHATASDAWKCIKANVFKLD